MREPALLNELHQNLWNSLKQIFDTDKISIAAAYGINISTFVLLLISSKNLAATITVIIAAIIFNLLILTAFKSSKSEVESIFQSIDLIYSDNDLQKYFNTSKADFYSRRYSLWMILTPFLMVACIGIAFALRS